MKMTTILAPLGICAAIGAAPAAFAETVLKFHHDLPEDSAQHVAAERFAELVAERTDGEIEVKIFPNNALADDVQAVQQMQFGAIEGAIIPTAKLSNFKPELQLPDLPFLFPTPAIAHAVLDGEVGEALLDKLGEVGLEGVTFWESGFKQFTCNNPVDSPDDFSGRKVRVMESPIIISQFKAMGATPVPIAFSETYTALQQRVVDCQENPFVSIVNMKFHEVQSDVILSNHAYLGYALVFSKMWFDKLDPETQEILRTAAREVTPFQREETARREAGYIDTINEGQATLTELAADARPAFEEATRSVHDEFREAIGGDLIDQAYAEIEALKGAGQ
ncbi:TRAP transporter substrate-binding protein [Palleronia sediminis]|uniref:TRAP transporter substrate-binding protein n=1 Tax=Palleronia sediminis TaxID=2547833 RepID=A0A4R6AIP9_9RHOB|nr:TRAP transporter substrate-binding protein [Palleronia sediminis]TDL81253.1 TRAP transporter substrate-binding protein [Palleronia sediminis]